MNECWRLVPGYVLEKGLCPHISSTSAQLASRKTVKDHYPYNAMGISIYTSCPRRWASGLLMILGPVPARGRQFLDF